MNKPELQIDGGKAAVTEGATRIYAAYVAAGRFQEDSDVDQWMKRSIREAFKIATTVDSSIENDDGHPRRSESASVDSGNSESQQGKREQPKRQSAVNEPSTEPEAGDEGDSPATMPDEDLMSLAQEDAGGKASDADDLDAAVELAEEEPRSEKAEDDKTK